MFELRKRLVSDFSEYIRSFLKVRDERILQFIESELDSGALWPEPLMGLNPTFESGGLVDNLVEEGILDPRCGTIFRRNKGSADAAGLPMRLHRHQVQAVQAAIAGSSYVLTTGTGSGKSVSYILPIVNSVLKHGSGKGIRAIVVYPMNALANSQVGELDKYLGFGPNAGAVSYKRYTGQESSEERDAIVANPPDILLTNYMMLELILTRPFERKLVEAMHGLQFVVLDELHTYRGRQGADVALLMRRLKQVTRSSHVQCIGTSATMATDGSAADRRSTVAGVASKLFGTEVRPDEVIGETLKTYSANEGVNKDQLASSIALPPPQTPDEFKAHPLTIWLERQAALEIDDEGQYRRKAPAPLFGAASTSSELAEFAGISQEDAKSAIQHHLALAEQLGEDESGVRAFIFRLHQFMSPGGGIFATLEPPTSSYLSLDGQKAAPDDPCKILFPLAFCRSCGQHYYIVTDQVTDQGVRSLVPRRLQDTYSDQGSEAGFLYIPEHAESVDLSSLIPDDWIEETKSGSRVRKNRQKHVPQPLSVTSDGLVGTGLNAWFIRQPFSLCMNPECGVSYGAREADITKLSVLGMQGRSTATTTLALSTLGYLKETEATAKKLLSFSDNRQDASLQSGHLNDFVEVSTLRAAIRSAAASAGTDGVAHDQIALSVENALRMDQDQYALQSATLPNQIKQRREALRDVLGYRIYRDLRRGWRVNAPNLEQVGLLKIDYPDLPYVCEDTDRWQGTHQLLVAATGSTREKVCRELLERMRKKLAVRVDYLDPEYQEGIRRRSSQYLKSPWALSEEELAMDSATYAWLDRSTNLEDRNDLNLTGASAYGIYLRQPSTLDLCGQKLTVQDTQNIIEDLVQVLAEASLIAKLEPRRGAEAFQLNAEAFTWVAIEPGEEHKRSHNRFFELLYREGAQKLKGIYAKEHTAQVAADEREKREQDFRRGQLPIMFCSPTMELGVDISDLSVVNLRNIPPTPANYAQRSGRAGRSGQAALVFSYCTAGSPHDQYYFRRPEQMVSGAVAPPRLDLGNEDLIRAHVHAIWLEEANLDLGKSLADKILDVAGDMPSLGLTEEIQEALKSEAIRERTKQRAQNLLDVLYANRPSPKWRTNRWMADAVGQIPLAFDQACDRWRNLYRSALEQQKRQNTVILDASSTSDARERAARLRREAENQIDLLVKSSSEFQSDFYTYRYFASEGFLPGYNFPRLPLTAYLPAVRGKDEYLSRPRFLAISEFGPQAVVYHEGSRFLVERVMLPPSMRQEGGQLAMGKSKLCTKCGYLHAGESADSSDVCERCSTSFEPESVIPNLFRLEGVSLRRRDRITCDEEERMRQGFEIRTGVRFDGKPGEENVERADVLDAEGSVIASLVYAPTATIWRINVGWNRRQDKSDLGFQLDLDKARWISDPKANVLIQSDPAEAAQRVAKVVPYVEDRRNALIFDWKESSLSPEEHASLQSALKSAIQAVFQLEDSELSAEPLPSMSERSSILMFESAEGGAGVLRLLVEDEKALQSVALKALELCHFDPDTLADQRKHPRAKDDCSAACYDCLLSYGNQRDHLLLDRFLVKDLLASLRTAKLKASSGLHTRSERLARLLQQCGSNLERDWLEMVEQLNLALPTKSQFRIADCNTVPDFVYIHGATKLVVYVDGPPHDYPARQLRDSDQDMALMSKGWIVQRFHHRDDWLEHFKQFPGVYGEAR